MNEAIFFDGDKARLRHYTLAELPGAITSLEDRPQVAVRYAVTLLVESDPPCDGNRCACDWELRALVDPSVKDWQIPTLERPLSRRGNIMTDASGCEWEIVFDRIRAVANEEARHFDGVSTNRGASAAQIQRSRAGGKGRARIQDDSDEAKFIKNEWKKCKLSKKEDKSRRVALLCANHDPAFLDKDGNSIDARCVKDTVARWKI